MKRIRIGHKNLYQINFNGHQFLQSYETIVACRIFATGEEWRCKERYSVTTSKHLNQWLSESAIMKPQKEIEKLYYEVLMEDSKPSNTNSLELA